MTHRERELLRFIERYQAANDGVSPSFDDMRINAGLASKSGMYRLVESLERQGLIKRERYHARNILVVPQIANLSNVSDNDLLSEMTRRGILKFYPSSIPSSSPNSLEPSAGIVPGASRGGGG